ncbi:MAG: T9SS type A sorting domain-containing protein [Ginsengibacter sp.]
MKKKIYSLLALCMLFYFPQRSIAQQKKFSKPYYAQAGIKRQISALRSHANAATLKSKVLDSTSVKPYKSYFKKAQDFGRAPAKIIGRISAPGLSNNRVNLFPATPSSPMNTGSTTQQLWSNFLSIDFYENPIGWPPDPNGAVGESQVIVAANNGLKVYDKPGVTGSPLVTPNGYSGVRADGTLFISLEEFFSPVLPLTSGISDPHIRYDRLSKKWFVVAIEVNPSQENNLIFLAVSDDEKITDASSFTFYSFNSSLFPYDPAAPYGPFLDYPTLGIDNNAVVIGGNQFGYDSLTNVGYVIDKKKLLKGKLVIYPIELGMASFIDGSVSGMYTPQGVYNDDPSARQSFFTGITYYQDGLVLATLRYDKKNQPLLVETTIPVEPFSGPRDNSHPGSLGPLDVNDTRLLEASIHTNKLNGKSSLWTAHAIGVDQSGHYPGGTDSDFVKHARTGARWYEIENIYSQPNLRQAGTVNDYEQPSGRRAIQYFNPTIAQSGQGHAVLSGTLDAYNEYLNVFVAGRYNDDAKGILNSPVKATTTTAMYEPYVDLGGGSHIYVNRWGDFSQTVVDPSDDQTIWTFQEYANVDDSYGVRVVQVKAPPPATPAPLGAISNKADTVIWLKGQSSNNSGFFDPGKDKGGPGYNRLSVKSTGDIVVSNIRFKDPTNISFKLNTKNKPGGNYFLVITNPDGQIAVAEYSINAETPATVAGQQRGLLSETDEANIFAQKYVVSSDVYPNPTNGGVKLMVNAAKDFNGKILLLTASGKTISENTFSFNKGKRELSLSLANLSSGNYIAALFNESNVLIAVHKIVKQ